MLFKTKKVKSVGKHFILEESDIKSFTTNINKIIGQLETIKKDLSTNSTCDDSLTQILAIKGGVESLGRNMVGKGLLDCLDDYSKDELELIIKNLFKLT